MTTGEELIYSNDTTTPVIYPDDNTTIVILRPSKHLNRFIQLYMCELKIVRYIIHVVDMVIVGII
jgi:hypothetical protein